MKRNFFIKIGSLKVILLVCNLLLSASLISIKAQTTLALFEITSGSLASSVGTGLTLYTPETGINISSSSGNPGGCLQHVKKSMSACEFEMPTSGYKDITFSFDYKPNNTQDIGELVLYAAVGSDSYQKIESFTSTLVSKWYTKAFNPLSSTYNNKSKIRFKLVYEATTGTKEFNIDNIKVVGTKQQGLLNVDQGSNVNICGSSTAVDFGNISLGTVSTQKEFVLRNVEPGTLLISNISCSSGYVIVGDKPTSIAEGGQTKIVVQFTGSTAAGINNGTLTIANSGSTTPCVINLTSTVLAVPTSGAMNFYVTKTVLDDLPLVQTSRGLEGAFNKIIDYIKANHSTTNKFDANIYFDASGYVIVDRAIATLANMEYLNINIKKNSKQTVAQGLKFTTKNSFLSLSGCENAKVTVDSLNFEISSPDYNPIVVNLTNFNISEMQLSNCSFYRLAKSANAMSDPVISLPFGESSNYKIINNSFKWVGNAIHFVDYNDSKTKNTLVINGNTFYDEDNTDTPLYINNPNLEFENNKITGANTALNLESVTISKFNNNVFDGNKIDVYMDDDTGQDYYFVNTNTLNYTPNAVGNTFSNTKNYTFYCNEQSYAYIIGQNLDKPVYIHRYDASSDADVRQTIISSANPIQNQIKRDYEPVVSSATLENTTLTINYSVPNCTTEVVASESNNTGYVVDFYETNADGYLVKYLGHSTYYSSIQNSLTTQLTNVPGDLTRVALTVTNLGKGGTTDVIYAPVTIINTACLPSGCNLIGNGDFQQTSDRNPCNWTAVKTYDVHDTNVEIISGLEGYKHYFPIESTNNIYSLMDQEGYVKTSVSITNGKKYNLQFNLDQGTIPGTINIYLHSSETNKFQLIYSGNPRYSAQTHPKWHKLIVDQFVANDNYNELFFEQCCEGSQMYLDNVFLEEAGCTPPAVLSSCLCNFTETPEKQGFTKIQRTEIEGNLDDGSKGDSIALGFDFTLFNHKYSKIYVNINGNVTFKSTYSVYSTSGLNTSGLPAMIAPYWSDIDLRGTTDGDMYYKFLKNDFGNNVGIQILWNNLGYYPYESDKRVTFQLTLTNGDNSFLSEGSNVSFCYKKLGFTTGSASCGSGDALTRCISHRDPSNLKYYCGDGGGFGGTPATVGVSLGNGIDYYQIGRFDHIDETNLEEFKGPMYDPSCVISGQDGYTYDPVNWLLNNSASCDLAFKFDSLYNVRAYGCNGKDSYKLDVYLLTGLMPTTGKMYVKYDGNILETVALSNNNKPYQKKFSESADGQYHTVSFSFSDANGAYVKRIKAPICTSECELETNYLANGDFESSNVGTLSGNSISSWFSISNAYDSIKTLDNNHVAVLRSSSVKGTDGIGARYSFEANKPYKIDFSYLSIDKSKLYVYATNEEVSALTPEKLLSGKTNSVLITEEDLNESEDWQKLSIPTIFDKAYNKLVFLGADNTIYIDSVEIKDYCDITIKTSGTPSSDQCKLISNGDFESYTGTNIYLGQVPGWGASKYSQLITGTNTSAKIGSAGIIYTAAQITKGNRYTLKFNLYNHFEQLKRSRWSWFYRVIRKYYNYYASSVKVYLYGSNGIKYLGRYNSDNTWGNIEVSINSLDTDYEYVIFVCTGASTNTYAQIDDVSIQKDGCSTSIPPCSDQCIASFAPKPGEKYVLSAWVKELGDNVDTVSTYRNAYIDIYYDGANVTSVPFYGKGAVIDGWQRIEEEFVIPANAMKIAIRLNSGGATSALFDDVRVHPFGASMKSYVYDPVSMKLVAELDERNYATIYDYDEEGQLIRVKKETERGVKTIQESFSHTHNEKK